MPCFTLFTSLIKYDKALETAALMGVISPLTERIKALASNSASYAWPPLLSLSRNAILSVLVQIKVGQVKIVDVDGKETVCGQQKMMPSSSKARSVYSIPQVQLHVHKDIFWVRMALFADMVRLLLPKPPVSFLT